MELLLVGLSHRTAGIDLREKVAFSGEDVGRAILAIKRLPQIDEAMLLSTCNRTEVLVASTSGTSLGHAVINFLIEDRKLPQEALSGIVYRYSSKDAIRHLFRVASSLDSMVVGEPQILGQVKDAYYKACESGACGPLLNRLLHRTFRTAKRVRTETKIAENAVSVSYAGVELGRRIFGKLEGKEALLVGAGEMAELAVQHLLANGLSKITIANRTRERAAALAEKFGGYSVAWEEIDEQLVKADIAITSAGAPHYIVRRDRMEKVMRQRKFRPLFIIDLAVPRNVEPSVGKVEACYVYDLDDLEGVVEENKKARFEEAQKAETIISEETEDFIAYLNSLQVVPTIVALQNRLEAIRQAELEKALSHIPDLSEESRERVTYLTKAITKKFLHTPISALKAAERNGTGDEITQIAKRLFDIEAEADEATQASLRKVVDPGES